MVFDRVEYIEKNIVEALTEGKEYAGLKEIQ